MSKHSFYVASELSSDAKAKWMFNTGNLGSQDFDDEEDLCWEKQLTSSTTPLDLDDDSSITSENDFASEDSVDEDDIQRPQDQAPEESFSSPSPSSPSPLDAMLNEFREMSSGHAASGPSSPLRWTISSAEATKSNFGRRTLKSSKHPRVRLADKNRDMIRSSMRHMLDV